MENNQNISPKWKRFRSIWFWVAVALFLILLIMLLADRVPWCDDCQPKPKVVEKETLVDNPEHLTRISVLEKENAMIAGLKQENEQIAGLKANVADLTKSSGLVAGLQAKVKALEGVDLNFESPKLMSKINLLETENASIADLKKRILELEASNAGTNDDRNALLMKQVDDLKAENGLIAGLKAKVSALEAIDVNFIKPQDDTKLIQKINNLEVQALKIPLLESRISELKTENGMIPGLNAKVKALEAIDINFTQPEDNTELLAKITDLEKQAGLVSGLQAKVKALEAIDINFAKPADNSGLMQKINNLEIQTLKIPTLESQISELKAENGMIPGMKAKIKALEAIDINFISNDSTQSSTPQMALPEVAKLFFETGSSRFPSDVTQSMANVMVYLRANPNATVSLAGYHDASGNLNWNRRLASKRSNRVKQILLDAGIAPNRINVQKPSQTLGSGSPEEARRVEVIVSN